MSLKTLGGGFHRTLLKDARPALSDLLVWDHFAAEGVLRTIDGAWLSTWEFVGPDLSGELPAAGEHLAGVMARALGLLGDGWLVHVEGVRRSAPGYPARGNFESHYLAALDRYRKERFAASERRHRTRYFLTLTFQPGQSALARAMKGAATGATGALEAERQSLQRFASRRDEVAELLRNDLELRLLGNDELARHLFSAVTMTEQPLELPHGELSLGSLVSAVHLRMEPELIANGRPVGVVSVTNFPARPSLGKLAFLNRLPFPLRSSVRLVPMDPATARRAVMGPRGLRRKWQVSGMKWGKALAAGKEAKASEVQGAYGGSMAAQAEAAAELLEEAETSLAALSWTLVLTAQDRGSLARDLQILLGELRRQGFVADAEAFNAMEAWLGSLPGHGVPNLRRPLLHLPAAARLLLLTSVWTGAEQHPHPALEGPHVVGRSADGSNPFFLCLGERDVGHTLVVGPTGAGKSTLLALLVAQWFRYPRAQAFVLDKGRSLEPLTLAAGGQHYRLGAGGQSCVLGPFEGVEHEARRAHLSGWLEETLRLLGVAVGPRERTQIREALASYAASRAEKTLTGFTTKLAAASPALAEALSPYAQGGGWGDLLGGAGNPLRAGRFHTFEMGDLLQQPEAIKVPVILHLLHEIEDRFDGSPTLLVIEEAVRYLGETLWARRIEDWLLQLRKKNVAVVLVSQLLSAFIRSGIGDALQQSCPTKIFLPNREAGQEGVAADYARYGLNPVQIETLAHAVPAREYLVLSSGRSALVDFDLAPAELAVFGAGDPESLERLAHYRAGGPRWLEDYMRDLGHEDFVAHLPKEPR